MARGKKKTASNEALKAELAPYQQESMSLLQFVSSFRIETQEHANAIGQLVIGCANKREQLEESLAKILKPAKETIEAAKAEYCMIDTYKQVEKLGKAMIDQHLRTQKQTEAAALVAVAAAPELASTTLAVFDHHVEAPLPVRNVQVFSVSDEIAMKVAVCRAYVYMHKNHPGLEPEGNVRPALAQALEIHLPTVKKLHAELPVPGCLLTTEQRSTL